MFYRELCIYARQFVSQSSSFYQINYGYWLTKKDVLSIEAITWRYHAPLGIPYGPSFESEEENYSGYVRSYGVGLSYQRYIYKGFCMQVHTMPFIQKFLDEDMKKIQKGFQLFMTLRAGYHIRLFKDRLFLEPSIACTHWPVNTNVPESFAQKEAKWPIIFYWSRDYILELNFDK